MRTLPVPQLPNPGTPHWGSQLVKALTDWFQPAVAQINETVGPAIASATTITITNAIHHVTGTTEIDKINVPQGFSGSVKLIPDGAFTTAVVAAPNGNIAKASTAVVGQVMILTYDPATSKFYPSY